MTILDRTLAFLAVGGLFAFLGIVGWFVPEADLIIVFVIGAGMAVFDFVNSFRKRTNGNDRPEA